MAYDAVRHLISQIVVVFLVLELYRLFKPVNNDRAVLMVVLALLGILIKGVAVERWQQVALA